MNHLKTKRLSRGGLCGAILAGAICHQALAQTISNPGFEANSFSTAPGYVADNAAITGWTADNPSAAGLNPAGGESMFADNGAIPGGQNVAFILGGASLSTTISGLTAGEVYKVTLQANAATNHAPILRATIDGSDAIALNIYTVGADRPYEYVAFEFTAASATAALAIFNDGAPEHALLIDNVMVEESSGRWQVDAWTDDSTSGVDNQFVYTHAYNVGSAANALINGVPFTGVAGANPSVSNKFTMTRFANVFGGDANNITGGSAAMARDFLYNGANVVSGTYQTIQLFGLTPGTEYVATIYSAGWESPAVAWRWATFSVGEDRLTVNQDQFDNNNGIRLSYRYTAGTNGTASLNIAPINPVNVSIHVYGFSNREAVSRNVAPSITAQPAGITLAAGAPLSLFVGAGGFPAPSYQWRFNGAPIQGANAATNTIEAIAAANAGLYDVVVTNALGAVTSAVARVIVGLPMANSSFEADVFEAWPGYSGDNPGSANTPSGPNVPITGWTQSSQERSGINPIAVGDSPFADNGTIPHGRQVAFIQSINDEVNTLSQVVEGLSVGSQYYLHYFENSRGATANPFLEVSLGGQVVIPSHAVPAGAYREMFSDVFTATSTSIEVLFSKTSPGGADTTVLIDNVAIVPVAAGTAPFIVRQPAAAAAYLNESASFSAQVLGSLPLSYQWLRNGSPISGATNAMLTLTNVQLAAAGEYSLQVTNSGGTVISSAVRLSVNQRITTLFNTGVDENGAPLEDGMFDPHYKLIVNPHNGLEEAVVQDSTVFPIVAGPWLANDAAGKWIGPELNTVSGAVGLYTYRTTFDLTGLDPRSVVIIGRWAVDNAGRDILVNGVSTGNAESPGFNAYTSFAIYGTNVTLNAGTNHLDFIVENVDAIGYTGLRVEIQQSNATAGTGGGDAPRLQVARSGSTLNISWSPAASGQKLQSSARVDGPWADVPNASNPHTVNAGTGTQFFRVIR